MVTTKAKANVYVKEYVRAIFEQRLREEGFICPDARLLCWYRVNGEVLDTIIFRIEWLSLPLFLNLTYEIEPLFTKPFYTKYSHTLFSVSTRSDCMYDQGNFEEGPLNAANLRQFSPDIAVFAPGHGGRGIYSFNEVLLPLFNRITTVEACHNYHKERMISPNLPPIEIQNASPELIDEGIYVDDQQWLPYFPEAIHKGRDLFQELVKQKPHRKDFTEKLQHWELLDHIYLQQGREAYLEVLERRQEEIIAQLKQQGIIC